MKEHFSFKPSFELGADERGKYLDTKISEMASTINRYYYEEIDAMIFSVLDTEKLEQIKALIDAELEARRVK